MSEPKTENEPAHVASQSQENENEKVVKPSEEPEVGASTLDDNDSPVDMEQLRRNVSNDVLEEQLEQLLQQKEEMLAAEETEENERSQLFGIPNFGGSGNAEAAPKVEQTLLDASFLSIENLTPQEKKCICGIVACLLYWDRQLAMQRGATDGATRHPSSHLDATRPELYLQVKHGSWQREYFKAFLKHLEIPEMEAVGFLPLLEEEVDPQPFLQSLGPEWHTEDGALRLLLVVLNFSTTSMIGLDARVQHQLRRLCVLVGRDWMWFLQQENRYAATMKEQLLAEGDTKKSSNRNKWKIGLLAVGGGLALAFTGGLAAPALGAGMMSLGLGSAAVLTTSAGATFIATVFGVTGTALVGQKANHRYKDISEFLFERIDVNFHARKSNRFADEKEDGAMAAAASEDENEKQKEEKQKKKDEKALRKELERQIKEQTEAMKNERNAMSIVICIDGWMYRGLDYRIKWRSLCMSQKTKKATHASGDPSTPAPPAKEETEATPNKAKKSDKKSKGKEDPTPPQPILDEVYTIKWESEVLENLGHAMTDFAVSTLKSEGTKAVIQQTVLRGLFAAVAWPLTVLSAANLIGKNLMHVVCLCCVCVFSHVYRIPFQNILLRSLLMLFFSNHLR